MDIRKMLEENARRHARRAEVYNPVTGEGADGPRTCVECGFPDMPRAWLPEAMLADPLYPAAARNFKAWRRLRIRHDFEYWAVSAAHIKDKVSGAYIPFRLNRPQRKVLAALEDMRRRQKPLRIIILKARQWGGSTIVQMYMAWIQSVLRRNWHSLVCGHVKEAAANIRGMYSRMLERYPLDLWEGDEEGKPKFRPFEGSANTREIAGRGCRVTMGSSEAQEGARGADFAMVHLSEAAFWGDSSRHKPDDFIRAVCGGVLLEPLTLVAVESTADGQGNWFHREWLRAEKGLSDKLPLFVAWHEIEIYSTPLPADIPAALAALSDYEMKLWDDFPAITLEQIWWYHLKRKEMGSDREMNAEFPSTPLEAFTATGKGVFAPEHIDYLRTLCIPDAAMPRGEVDGFPPMFISDSRGRFVMVERPDGDSSMMDRYVVGVDVGGRSENSDFSVICVVDRQPLTRGLPLRIVAQWRGHCDYDVLALKAVAIARFYSQALLVVESNTLEHRDSCPGGMGVIPLLARIYPNLYSRPAIDSPYDPPTSKLGFHTNRSTKLALISCLQRYVRERLFVDPFAEALDEMATYEEPTAGVFAARVGCHDDMVMARALAIFVSDSLPLPRQIDIPPMTAIW